MGCVAYKDETYLDVVLKWVDDDENQTRGRVKVQEIKKFYALSAEFYYFSSFQFGSSSEPDH